MNVIRRYAMDQSTQKQDIIFPQKRPKYRTGRFIASSVCLIITLFFILIFVDLMITINLEAKAEKPDVSISAVAIVSLYIVFSGILLFSTALTSSFFGFCLGYSSINYLPTKKLSVWAKVVTYANLVIAILSAIPALYFIWLLFIN